MSISDQIHLAVEEVREGRFQRTMALLTGFSAIASGFETYIQHQRGAFNHWLMWTPVWLTPPTALASVAAMFSKVAATRLLPAISLVSLLDGMVGFIYHIKGIQHLPGGFKIGQYNIVIGPPIFAPLLTCMVGFMGVIAGFLRREKTSEAALHIADLRSKVQHRSGLGATGIAQSKFQRGMALTAAIFAALAGGEAYFEHLRGSYNQRVMWTPVWLTPFMVAAAIGAAASERVARLVLPFVSLATMLDGALGFLLHLNGVRRMPGGFSNLRFNITLGPPLFAPLLFSAVGLLGLIAALLRRNRDT